MNEKLPQTNKLKFIETLLECPAGQEVQLFENNQHLLDSELVREVTQTAKSLAEQEDFNAAEYLIIVANYLAENLNNSSSLFPRFPFPNPKSQLAFLLQTLQIWIDSHEDLHSIYIKYG